jgi:cytoskeletal protein RodZ
MAVGEFLKQQRTIRKLDLATIANAIGLDVGLLSKIEEDEAGHIAPVYRNGYIQAYASYLQIPEDEIQVLINRTSSEETSLRTVFIEPAKRNPIDNWIRISSYVLASMLIGTLAWQFTHEAVRLSQNGAIPGNLPQSGPVNASIASLDVIKDGRPNGAGIAESTWPAISEAPLPEGESRLQVSVSADSWVDCR